VSFEALRDARIATSDPNRTLGLLEGKRRSSSEAYNPRAVFEMVVGNKAVGVDARPAS
jgi:hypothetical protein